MKDTKPKQIKTLASDMIILAALAYLALQIQPLVNYIIVWTPLIDTVRLNDKIWTLIMHVVCMAAWGGIALLLMHMSRVDCGYKVIEGAKAPSRIRLIVAAAISVAVSAAMIIFAGGFSIPYAINGIGDLLYTVEYYIFLIVNAAMFVLVMAFGQKFGDLAFGESCIPYGGIVLGLGMALTNIISGFSAGVDVNAGDVLLSAAIVFVYALVYGAVYVITEKKPLYALPFVALIFVLI